MAINVPLNAQLQNATQLQQQIQNAVNSVRINLGGQNGARALSSLSQPLGRLTGQADEFTKSLDAANARVLAFGASVGVVNAVTNAFKSLVNSTIEVEKAITAISVVGDQFTGKTKELSQGLFSIAKATGQSFSEVSKAALEFSRQGLNLEDTLSRTQDALVLTRLTGLDAAKSVDGLTAAVNAFSKAGLSTTQIINKLAAVDQAFAVSSADLIEGFNRSAAVAQNAGVTFDELAGIITALQQETSRGGAVIGNALKTIFTRLQDTSTLNQLQNLGIAVQDLQGNILPARQILQNLATDIEGLGQITKAGIFKDVAGTFQINQLISLVGDLNKENSVSADATRKAASATNEAFIANEKLNQSLDAVLGKVANTGKQLGSILGELGLTDNLKGLLDGINSFLEGASSLLQGDDLGSNFAKGFVKGIGAVLSGPGLGIFLAIIGKLSLDLAKFGAQSLKAFFGIGKAAADQKQVQESIVQTLLKNQSVLSSILNTQGGQNAQALKFLGLLNQQAAAMQSIQSLAGGIASTVYAGGFRATAGGLQRKAAGGYLPAQEASDVRRGVGGASPSSKVVSIPNFAFGGGKRGTMIANTSEYIVPNYAGGGSAIFNQDMVKTMGLPAGAKKISAAGGFVPNFADATNALDVSRKYALIINKAISPKIGEIFSYKPKGSEDAISYRANIYGINERKIKNNKGLFEEYFSSDALVRKYTEIALRDASDYSSAVVGKPISPVAVKKLSNAGSIPSLVGAIFESGITAAIEDPELIKAQQEGNPNAPFDFIGTPKLNEFFGIPPSVPYVEAKYNDTPDAKKSFAGKIFKAESGITKGLQEALARKSISNIDKLKENWSFYNSIPPKSRGNYRNLYNDLVLDLGLNPTTQKDTLNKQINRALGTAASGYIPNFAAAALQQAIAREKSAGLSNSQIYVDQNSSLKSPLNPMGLMVANTRDEPFGGIQGISRARNEGANPKTYGASKGFVPNFVPMLSGYSASLNQPVNTGNVEAVNKGFGDMAGKIFLIQSALAFMNGAVGEATTSFGKLAQQTTTTIGNISSLGFFGKQLLDMKTATSGVTGVLGKFAKNAGLVGVGIGIAVEGFNLLDFATKEFSGQNKKTADALAKLETAAQGAIISLEDFTPEGQKRAQETGQEALKAFEGSSLPFFKGASQNPEIQKQAGVLSAQGLDPQILKNLIEKQSIAEAVKREQGNPNLKPEEIDIMVQEAIDNGLDVTGRVTEADLGKVLSDAFNFSEVKEASSNLATIREGLKSGRFGESPSIENIDKNLLKNLDPKIIDSLIQKFKIIGQTQKAIVEEDKRLALGQRVSIELAKQKLDNLIQQKKEQIDLNASVGIDGVRFELETLDVSESYRNELEKRIKLKEIDAELSKKNLDIVSAAIDKLTSLPSDAKLGVSAEQFAGIAEALKGENIQSAKDLQEAVDKIGAKLGLVPDQLKGVNELFKDQFDNASKIADAQKQSAENTATFNSKVIDTKNSLQAARLLTEQIANDLERAAGVRLSFAEVGFNAKENQIKLLRAQASSSATDSGKKSFEARAVQLEKELNEERRLSSEDKFQSDKRGLEGIKNQAQKDLLLKSKQFSEGKIDFGQLTEAGTAFKNADEKLIKLINSQEIARQNFAQTSEELGIQAQNIYRVIGAFDALTNSIDQFKLGAGERIGGAMFEQLGATDINSLMQARIKQNTETEAQTKNFANDQDYYKFIQEETKLRQIQFDLATAESATRKRELEYELKYTQEIIDLKNKGATEQELIDARNRQISEQRSGARGFEKGLDTIQDRINNYRTTLGEEIPNLFSSNLAQGLNDAISGAKDLKTALTDAATSFFQEITRKNISNLADMATKGLGSLAETGFGALKSAFSGGVTTKASGGLISGGSGTKDDVPAMLMGGEYVVKKSAVSKYGKGFLDAINSGSMRGYATGGMVDPQTFPTQTGRGGFFTPGDYGQGAITGKNELLTFASQSFTGGQYDYMGGFGMGGATVSLEPESARLSALGREGSPMFERVQQSKDEAFRVYLEGLQKEKEYSELLDQIAKDKKARKKQLQTAIISAVVSSAASYAGSAMAAGASNAAGAAKAAGKGFFGQTFAGAKGAIGFGGETGQGGLGNLLTGNFSKAFTNLGSIAKTQGATPQYNFDTTKSLRGVTVGNRSFAAPRGIKQEQTLEKNLDILSENDLLNMSLKNFGTDGFYNPYYSNKSGAELLLPPADFKPTRRASGGLISGGSNIRDDVPTMLTGGEFVLNNRATQRIGLQNLNKLNNGQSVGGEGASAEMTQALISKLDELIQATQNSSSENVVVNVSSNEAGGQNQENPAGAEKELHKKIRQAVLDVIAQEKRLGGSLEKSR